MNKQEALYKLVQVRLAINYVLRNRMTKQAGNPFYKYDVAAHMSDTAGPTNTADLPEARQNFLKNNRSFGPRIPISIGIPWTDIRWQTENINPFYTDPTELRDRLRIQNRNDQRKNLLPHLRGSFDSFGMKTDPTRQYYDENKEMLDNYRTRYNNNDLDRDEQDAYHFMEGAFKSMYPTDSF